MPRPAVADAEVVDRPDIGAAQLEDEEHLRGPSPHAPDGDQPLDYLVVCEPIEVVRRHRTVDELRRQVDDRGELVRGKPGGAQRLGSGREHGLGMDRRAAQGGEHATVDGCRGGARELLEHDGAHEGFERRVGRLAKLRAQIGVDDASKRGVGADDVRGCGSSFRHDAGGSAIVASPSTTRAPGSRSRPDGASLIFIERLPPPMTTDSRSMTRASMYSGRESGRPNGVTPPIIIPVSA